VHAGPEGIVIRGSRLLLRVLRPAPADPGNAPMRGRVIAQSISWELPSAVRRAVTAAHERAVPEAGGVVIRYGQLYGPGTYHPSAPPRPPRIHVDDATRRSLPALTAPSGVTLVADDRAACDRKD
jgi:hypothetical protein